MVDLSIIIPAFNEQDSIIPLYEELTSVLKYVKRSYEIIYVDDGSKDKTLENIKLLSKKDKRVKYISFKKNFQKASALSAGFLYSKGQIIITMDADLQEDPRDIPKFLDRIQHYDVVVGWKYNRMDSVFRMFSSRVFNILVKMLLGLRVHDNDCNYKAMRRRVLENINIYGGLYRYIPALAANKGHRVSEVKVNHRRRKFGKSKYGIRRIFWGILDLLTIKFLISYTRKPLHAFGLLGFGSLVMGFLIGAYLLYVKLLLGISIGNRPLLILSLLLIVVGVQFLSLGLVGELITSYNQRNTDQYTISEKNIK